MCHWWMPTITLINPFFTLTSYACLNRLIIMKIATKELTVKDVFITVTAQNEDANEAYSQLGDCMSKKQISRLLEKAESNEWHWCNVTVQVEYTDENGTEYTAETYLGGCSYKSRMDFVKNSGYYDDMLAEVLTDLNSQF